MGTELWRRTLRGRTARWVHAVTIVLCIAAASLAGYAQWPLRSGAATDAAPYEKTTMLAQAISRAMNCNAFAFLAVGLAVIVLAVATYRARHVPRGGDVPEA